MTRGEDARDTLIAMLAFLVLAVAVTWPLATRLSTSLPINSGDSLLNAWTLAWSSDRLGHGLRGFWQMPSYYPYTASAAFSENLLGVAVVAAPVYWLTHDAGVTYNVALILSYALSGLTMFVLVRRLTSSPLAAFLAGCIFAFAPYRAGQMDHLQVLSAWWMPLAFWAMHLLLDTERPIAALVFGVCFVLQTFAHGYAFFFMCLGCGVLILVRLISGTMPPRVTRALLVIALLGFVAMLPMARTIYTVWGTRAAEDGVVGNTSADLGTFLQVPVEAPLHRVLPGVVQLEGGLFPGVIAVGLVGIGLWLGSRKGSSQRLTIVTYGLIAFVGLLMALGPAPRVWRHTLLPVGPFALFQRYVPLSSIARIPARFGMLTSFGLAVIAGVGASWLLARVPRRRAMGAVAVAALVITWEGSGAPIRLVGAPAVNAPEYAWLAARPDKDPLLELPIAQLGLKHTGLVVQYASLRHGHRVVNGVSRFEPPLVGLFDWSSSPLADPDHAREIIPLVSALHVRYVMVRPALFSDARIAQAVVDAFQQDEVYVESAQDFPDGWMFVVRPSSPSLPAPSTLAQVPASALTVHASDNRTGMAQAIDGMRDTRWLTGRPQDGTEWFAVDLDHPRDIATLRIAVERSMTDYPRELEVVSMVDGKEGPTLFRGAVLGALGAGVLANPEHPDLVLPLPPNRSSGLLLKQHGHASSWFWSIDELTLHEAVTPR